MDRRKFIQSLIRGSLFTGLGTGSYYLLNRKRDMDGECRYEFICQNCQRKSICKLPEASRFRYLNKRAKQND